MTELLSLKEAEKYTGKSRSTLRRFVVTITKPDDHPDRGLIQATVEEVELYHSENHPFSWLVDRSLLDREFPKKGSNQSQQSPGNEASPTNRFFEKAIAMLENELIEKNKQIAEFQERQKETNILLKNTTEKLVLLTEGQTKPSEPSQTLIVANEKQKEKTFVSKKESLWDKLNKPLFTRR